MEKPYPYVAGSIVWAKTKEAVWWPGVIFTSWREVEKWDLQLPPTDARGRLPVVGARDVIVCFFESFTFDVLEATNTVDLKAWVELETAVALDACAAAGSVRARLAKAIREAETCLELRNGAVTQPAVTHTLVSFEFRGRKEALGLEFAWVERPHGGMPPELSDQSAAAPATDTGAIMPAIAPVDSDAATAPLESEGASEPDNSAAVEGKPAASASAPFAPPVAVRAVGVRNARSGSVDSADESVTPRARRALALPEVTAVRRGSAAHRAGVVVGDVLISRDGAPVRSAAALRSLLTGRLAGASFTLEFARALDGVTRVRTTSSTAGRALVNDAPGASGPSPKHARLS